MNASSGSTAEGFTLKDVNLRFETVMFQPFDPEAYEEGKNVAADVRANYMAGKQINTTIHTAPSRKYGKRLAPLR